MRAVVTRVNHATVHIEGELRAKIGKGLLIFLGVHRNDTEKEAIKTADKICGLRIFEDEAGKMNLAPGAIGAEILIVSQFTLFADCRSRRPGFSDAARPYRCTSWSYSSAVTVVFPYRPVFSPLK